MYLLDEGEENVFQDLAPLGDTDWPDGVKAEIAEFFTRAGVRDPMRQKLVEPGLRGFRFRNDRGEIDWDDVVAYFKYEALTVLIMHDPKSRARAEELYAEFFAGHKSRVRSRAGEK